METYLVIRSKLVISQALEKGHELVLLVCTIESVVMQN